MAKGKPLWLHPSGHWCKKRGSTFYYFGKDETEAMRRYRAEWDDILAGRTERATIPADPLTVSDLANHFLRAKEAKLAAGQIASRTVSDYHETAKFIVGCLGRNRFVEDLQPDDFAGMMLKLSGYNPTTVANIVTKVRTIFKYGEKALLLSHPVAFGLSFDKPSKKSLRLARTSKLLEAEAIRKLLGDAKA